MGNIAVTKVPKHPDIELPAFYESFAWYYPNCELQTKNWFVENAASDWIYFDCGANIGYYSILFSRLSGEGRVHAIEPTSTAEMLRKNIEHNKCQNITVHNIALAEFTGKRNEKIYRIWGQEPEVIDYEFISIDSLAENLQLNKLDCIKIDVDSFDFEVLKGAEQTLKRFNPWIIVELSNSLALRNSSVVEVLLWLKARGYKGACIYDHENYVFKRDAENPGKDEIPIDLIIWLYQKDILYDVVMEVNKDTSSEYPWANKNYAIESMASLVKSPVITKLRSQTADIENNTAKQCVQYAAFVNHFTPDCILQFGRWSGENTLALSMGMPSNCEFWSFCKSNYFRNTKIESVIEKIYPAINILFDYPAKSLINEIINRGNRILIFWDDTSEEVGNIILGQIMPLMRDKIHVVITRDLWDGRYKTLPESSVSAVGTIWSSRNDLLKILDYTTRNNLRLYSPERAFKRIVESDSKLEAQLKSDLGSLYMPSAGWHWFTTNGSPVATIMSTTR
jgi:FkbM family methyltransferase